MDIATILGLLGGVGVLFGAIAIEGSNPMAFVNLLATVVVFGGATVAVLVRYTLKSFVAALIAGITGAVRYKHTPTIELIDQIAEVAKQSDLIAAIGKPEFNEKLQQVFQGSVNG